MKISPAHKFLLSALFFPFAAFCVHAQTGFQNLNFESGTIPPGTQPATDVSASSALPGWVTSPNLIYDGVSGGGAFVSINDANTPNISFTPLQGRYSVILFAGPDIGAAGSSSISQMGLVPGNAQSILMDVAFPLGSMPSAVFTVSLGGQQIAMAPLQSFSDYTVYGGNISEFAGLNETLAISQFPPAPPNVPPSALALDDIRFSPSLVPEPSTWALMLCGAGAIGLVRRKSKA